MILVVDIGNSRIKWARIRSGKLENPGAADYEDETLHAKLDAVADNLGKPSAVAYCSVGASATGQILDGWANERFG
ncbi:MAG: type III pantothenate kinase, partial [Gammaproteobacteria bacterium]|nr:type III pantothenate kinase [Gammaproteobacteria bacterium]